MINVELEAQKALLARSILTEIEDMDTLKKLRKAFERMKKTKSAGIPEEAISKEEILAGIDAGLKELKQTMTGELKGKTAREFLNEL